MLAIDRGWILVHQEGFETYIILDVDKALPFSDGVTLAWCDSPNRPHRIRLDAHYSVQNIGD
jgi:hypothetical protein